LEGLDQADDPLQYGHETDDVNEIGGYCDGAPQGVLKHRYAGEDAKDAP
jgi:hypothetical protein